MYKVGSVPYVNAIPLTLSLEREDSLVQVVYEVPSALPPLLESGEAQAILVSSVDALRHPGRTMATGVCIGSHGPVESVRLFSKVPPRGIESLALDASSMTSNRLAQVLLAERYHVAPRIMTLPPDLDAMLEHADACVLIGDIGMTTDARDLHVLDLGEEWTDFTGKSFVWAAWIGDDGLTPELACLLAGAAEESGCGRGASGGPIAEECIRNASARPGWTEEMARAYFLQTMVYKMNFAMFDGLREFQKLLLKNGFSDCASFPSLVRPED